MYIYSIKMELVQIEFITLNKVYTIRNSVLFLIIILINEIIVIMMIISREFSSK